MTCTAWVESLDTRQDGRGKTYTSCQKHDALSLHDVVFLKNNHRYLLGVSCRTSQKSNLYTALSTQSVKGNKSIILHSQNTTEHVGYWSQVTDCRRKTLSRLTANSVVTTCTGICLLAFRIK